MRRKVRCFWSADMKGFVPITYVDLHCYGPLPFTIVEDIEVDGDDTKACRKAAQRAFAAAHPKEELLAMRQAERLHLAAMASHEWFKDPSCGNRCAKCNIRYGDAYVGEPTPICGETGAVILP